MGTIFEVKMAHSRLLWIEVTPPPPSPPPPSPRAGNNPVTLVPAKIILDVYHICCLFSYLHRSHLIIRARFGSVSCRITMFGAMFTHETKTVRIVPDSFSYHMLMWSRDAPDCWSRAYRIHAEPYKHDPNPI